jgi:hypothetical protein
MRRLPLALLTLVLLAAPAGFAHEIADPRVLVVVPSRDKLELRINELTPVPESGTLRRRFDGDRSGTLDDSELSDLTSYLAIRATRNLAVEEGGVALALTHATRDLRNKNNRADATDPLSVDVVVEARPAGAKDGSVNVLVKDSRADDHAVKAVVQASGVSLLAASAGVLDAKRGLVTGASLDGTHTLSLRYSR